MSNTLSCMMKQLINLTLRIRTLQWILLGRSALPVWNDYATFHRLSLLPSRADVMWIPYSWKCTTSGISIPCLLLWMALCRFYSVSQYTSHIIMVLQCCMNSNISTPFLSQESVAISFLVNVCFNFFSLFGECVWTHCFDHSLVSTFKVLQQ
jgi:hypothetical protein